MSAQSGTRPTPNIDRYLEDYTKKHDAFKQVAEYIEDACRSELQSAAIMGNVTSRAKDPARYKTKLLKMLDEKKEKPVDFASEKAIEDEIMDIIGVRVTLYFPSQLQEAVSKLQAVFSGANSDIDVKNITDFARGLSAEALVNMFAQEEAFLRINSPSSKIGEMKEYKPRYGNYRAVHLRFELNPVDLGVRLQEALGKRRMKVEVQIQALLMHAWSEVNHDIAYKTLSGPVSPQETYLLDLLCGVGKMGEIVLANLKRILESRMKVGTPSTGFASEFELAEFMRTQVAADMQSAQLFNLGDVEDFYNFLNAAKKNDQKVVQQELVQWKAGKKTDISVTNSLIGQILGKNEEPFMLISPFLLPQQNEFLTKGPGVPARNTHEILATIVDLALRPYIKSIPSNSTTQPPASVSYKALRDKSLYSNDLPAMPKAAYSINRTALAKKDVQDLLFKVVMEFDSYSIRYYLRQARIRAWEIYKGRTFSTTLFP